MSNVNLFVLYMKYYGSFTIYLIETPFNTFTNRADPGQTALVGAAWSGSALFSHGNMISYDPTLVDLTSYSFVFTYIIIHSGWSLAK